MKLANQIFKITGNTPEMDLGEEKEQEVHDLIDDCEDKSQLSKVHQDTRLPCFVKRKAWARIYQLNQIEKKENKNSIQAILEKTIKRYEKCIDINSTKLFCYTIRELANKFDLPTDGKDKEMVLIPMKSSICRFSVGMIPKNLEMFKLDSGLIVGKKLAEHLGQNYIKYNNSEKSEFEIF